MSYSRQFPGQARRPSPWAGSDHARRIQAREAAEPAANAPSKEELQTRIIAVQKVVQRDWDKGFLESLSGQLAKGRTLSPKQVETLIKIEHRNDPSVIEARNQWASNFTDEMREIAKVCARYYQANPPYYGDLCAKILNQPDFIPTEKQYRAMCENKYAMKVRAASFNAPIFPVGTLVSFRSTAPYGVKQVSTTGQAVVIRVDGLPVTSAAKGSKVYEVLPVGDPKTFIVEERHLKKMRQPKKK